MTPCPAETCSFTTAVKPHHRKCRGISSRALLGMLCIHGDLSVCCRHCCVLAAALQITGRLEEDTENNSSFSPTGQDGHVESRRGRDAPFPSSILRHDCHHGSPPGYKDSIFLAATCGSAAGVMSSLYSMMSHYSFPFYIIVFWFISCGDLCFSRSLPKVY